MFSKVLIANRGEIAARIIRTCRKMGIQTVAVYSEADQDSAYVSMADESYLIGKPRVSESYLNADKILDVAVKCGAQAVHPGYGLLSEHAGFARKVEEEGMTFIGPPSKVIAKMGDKVEARAEMKSAGVPIIPGTDGSVDSVEDAKRIADEFGYPVMLKAAAGGGGIGMQAVHNEQELEKAFAGNSKRAETFFGDGKMFLEKLIDKPRHIEIQVLADEHGNAIHLFERECSIQRRHQKVLEEAPSPSLSEATREKMYRSALKAVESLGYTNAGTLEFLVDQEENHYFLEMNTRLQVEHPVTEEITGVDIVEQQLRIAAKKPLSFGQEDVQRNGHAIEVRIYAEDSNTFYPSPGKLTKLRLPEGDGIRHETAICEGSEVTPFYDPMIAKLIVHGGDRQEAVERLTQAVHAYEIEGIKSNLMMLKRIVTHENFIIGDTKTDFIEVHYLPTLTK
ncbi:acetyl-CoA carboxylase biotin carboxylase subunit [Halobacillus sp. ACCC02827]|uniref:acetyl-CoA carboxylase biotin carboxylase subunit n=1 Tax=Halobacillus sp. ACCC02827 TaxID=3052090 RepID=UPI002570DED3|nr:acetyl-CoA carboxylase biotin carboxylase subunit [Halobacillus sp. ACCC02827]WJE17587.1 acetyl-CoA carboxylase biotin carboxylase subunit [Halobacillus sp. ACCC02827]